MKIALVEIFSAIGMLIVAPFGGFQLGELLKHFLAMHPTDTYLLDHNLYIKLSIFVLYLFAVLVIGLFTRFFVLFTGIALVRGPQAVGWSTPASCTGFLKWLNHSWSFFGKGVQERGERFFGFEVAFEGKLVE